MGVILTLRNTLMLSLLLGLTWIVILVPPGQQVSPAQQYLGVCLNSSTGLYILSTEEDQVFHIKLQTSIVVYSVILNTEVRTGIKDRISNINKNLAREKDAMVSIWRQSTVLVFFKYFLGSHESYLPDEAIIQNVQTVGSKHCSERRNYIFVIINEIYWHRK